MWWSKRPGGIAGFAIELMDLFFAGMQVSYPTGRKQNLNRIPLLAGMQVSYPTACLTCWNAVHCGWARVFRDRLIELHWISGSELASTTPAENACVPVACGECIRLHCTRVHYMCRAHERRPPGQCMDALAVVRTDPSPNTSWSNFYPKNSKYICWRNEL